MTFKCIHISDIHFRGLKRHDEYRTIFENFFNKAKELNPNIIFVGGDIVHSKTQGISPELIDILSWWFKGLATIAPTHIILGNHDGLILNQNRLDAITPIIEALKNPNLFLYKKSGVYPTGIKGFNWCVFSCFDHEGWKNVTPVENEINIATFHGSVLGSLTDSDWELEGEVNLKFFENYEFGFLGDIHKKQYLDLEQRIAYPGSTIQQNYGEELDKGFLFWEINSKFDYKSTFYKLENPHPYITIQCENVDQVIEDIKNFPNFGRFRIKSEVALNQNEIKLITSFLKEKKKAKEIIFKNDGIDQSIKHIEETRKSFNIWDEESRISMLKNYFKESLNEEQFNKILKLFKEALDHLPEDQNRKPTNWTLKSLEFSNTFSYGEDNYINFDNLNGIIGIFGKNAAGKSSIPGTIMYNLYNGTDRGSVKNIHIINTRKEKCETKSIIEVDNQKYQIERNTKKIPIKKKVNDFYSPTELILHRLSPSGELVNETDEQRRETEKVLRELIGTSDEFLMTSFASQGNINSFINEKSGSRKHYLSKFMNLDIFEELGKVGKENVSQLKGKLKAYQEKDWKSLKQKSLNEIDLNQNKMNNLEIELNDLNKKEIETLLILENFKNKNSNFEILKEIENDINSLNRSLESINLNKTTNLNALLEIETKIEKFIKFSEQVNINELKAEKERLGNLKSQLMIIMSQIEENKKDIKKKKDAHNLLNSVPCGTNFPTCRFIKNAYEDYQNIGDSEQIQQQLLNTFNELSSIIKDIEQAQIQTKIDKYEEHFRKNHQNMLQRDMIKQKIENFEQQLVNDEKRKNVSIEKLNTLKSSINSNDIENMNIYQKELEITQKNKNQITTNIISLKGQNSYLLKLIENYDNEEKVYFEILEEWKLHENFINCVSKKGLPAKLLKEMLPSLNKEVKDILAGVVDFTVDIEIDDDDLEVYLNYGGDQRRIIECASGMEKMISSLAIRVGLINVSNLPKSNIFIIDEGFGALDDTNIESCVRLLEGFKKYFKTILIISHVDAIKDIVEDTLNIETNGKDAYVRVE